MTKLQHPDFQIQWLALAANLYVLRIAVPHLKYFFLPVSFALLLWACLQFFRQPKNRFSPRKLLFHYFSLLLISLAYVWGMAQTPGISSFLLKESLNIPVLWGFVVLFLVFTPQKSDFDLFLQHFKHQFVFFVCIFAILGVTKFIFGLFCVHFSVLEYQDGRFPVGSSLVSDYNFYALASLVALIFLVFPLAGKKRLLLKQALIFLLLANVFLSLSRRGLLVLGLLCVAVWLWFLFLLFSKKRRQSLLLAKMVFPPLVVFVFLLWGGFYLFSEKKLSENPLFGESHACAAESFSRIEERYSSIANDRIVRLFLGKPAVSARPMGEMVGGRLARWKFGIKLFWEFSAQEKIWGTGFGYLQSYKLRFGAKGNKSYNEYPHNPLISALLYSGLAGAVCMLLFFVQTAIFFLKNRKKLAGYGLALLLVSFFSFVSKNSLLSASAFMLIALFGFYREFQMKFSTPVKKA